MSDALIPFGTRGWWTVDVDAGEIAAYYRITRKQLMTTDRRAGGLVAYAHDALVWKLSRRRNLSHSRIAELLKLERRQSVLEAVKRHEDRIRSYEQRFSSRAVDAEVVDA